MRTKSYVAYDGQVTWEMFPRQNLLFDVVLDSVMAAFPEALETAADGKIRFNQTKLAGQVATFIWTFGSTADIKFNLTEESDPMLHEYRDWWINSVNNADHRKVFTEFSLFADQPLLSEWYTAFNSTRGRELLAPEELRDKEGQKTDDPNLSGGATNT